MNKLKAQLKSLSLLDIVIIVMVIANIVLCCQAFYDGNMAKGFDKATIAILFANMVLASMIHRDCLEVVGDYQKISEIKSQIIDEQEEEIEALKQALAKAEAKSKK